MTHQHIGDMLGPGLGQGHVGVMGAGGVGKAFHLDMGAGMFFGVGGDAGDNVIGAWA